MRQFKISFFFFLIFLLTGCSPVHVKPVANFTLAPIHPIEVPNHTRTDLTLYVPTPNASPGYDTSDMVYMKKPFELSAFAVNRWVAPPAQMLLPIVVQMIRSTGYFKAVVAAPAIVTTDYRLDIQLLKLQQEFLLPQSKVRMEVQATLINNVSGKIVASQKFSAVVDSAYNPFGGVIAANNAVTAICQEIAYFTEHHAG